MNNKNQLEKYVEKEGLPSSPEHEAAILSALLDDKAAFELLTEAGIGKEYFYSPTMKSIYLACCQLIDSGKDIDILSVKAHLKKQGHSNENALNTLMGLLEINIPTFHVPTHIDGLAEFYQRREQTLQSIKLFKESFNGKFAIERKKDIVSCLESWEQIKNMDIKMEWVVDKIIPKGGITLVFGKGGVGKTWLLMDIARCIGSGVPWQGFDTMQASVIFIDFENPLTVLNSRMQNMECADNVLFWRGYNDSLNAPKLDSDDWKQYKSLPEGAILIFDTLRASQSRDENASNEMGLIMNRLKELRDSGFTIILLHHTAKNSDNVAKGSTAIVDLADHILGLTRVKRKKDGQKVVIDNEEGEDEDTTYRFGMHQKTRYTPYHVYLALNPDKGFVLAPDPQEDTLKNMHRILKEHGTINKTSFIENCKCTLGVSINKLRNLVDVGQGRYWDIENRPEEKNAKFITPKSVIQSSNPI
jgi:hypothetical protein